MVFEGDFVADRVTAGRSPRWIAIVPSIWAATSRYRASTGWVPDGDLRYHAEICDHRIVWKRRGTTWVPRRFVDQLAVQVSDDGAFAALPEAIRPNVALAPALSDPL